MNDYETTKFELTQLQEILSDIPNPSNDLTPYVWVLRDPATGNILVDYVVNGHIPLEARLSGDLNFN